MRRGTLRTDRSGLWRVFAAVLLGLAHAASFSPPLASWGLQLLSLAGLFALLQRAPAGWRGQLAPTTAFGIAWFASGVGWLHTSMHVYGGMPSLLAALAVLLFSAYLTLFPLGAVLLTDRLRAGACQGARADGIVGAVALAGGWGLSELLRGWVLTGFPWLSIGYAHVDGPLAGFAPLVGVYGIGMLAALAAATLALLPRALRQLDRSTILAAIALLVALPLTGTLLQQWSPTRSQGAPVQVRLTQGNVPQQLKFDRQRALQAMSDYTRMAEGAQARLIVMPETAWTVPWSGTPPVIAERLTAYAQRTGAALAIGMPLRQADGRYTNSVGLLGGEGLLARYDKHHLVPFGEFIPAGFGWFVRLMEIPLGEFGRGSTDQAPFVIDDQRFAFNICYEDLFGEELLPAIREGDATVLVNVSNIAWFGQSRALPQHLAIARMRTLETGRPMLRATNTGVTALIDHRGQVQARLPDHAPGVLDVSVQGTTGLTPYVRAGNLAPLGLAFALLALAWLWTARQRTAPR